MTRFEWHHREFVRLLKSPEVKGELEKIGTITVARCNAELHAAQARRRQPQEDGYAHKMTEGFDRARMLITTTTARAMAHEAVNNAILKNLPTGSSIPTPTPDHEIPRELGSRGNAGKGFA
jgi:hypothetical protein